MVVDHVRSSNAEKNIAPLQEVASMSQYKFDDKLHNHIKNEFTTFNWLDIKSVKFIKQNILNDQKEQYLLSANELVVFIGVKYLFSTNFNALMTYTQVDIYPVSKELKDIRNRVFNKGNGGRKEGPIKPIEIGLFSKVDVATKIYANKIQIFARAPFSEDLKNKQFWYDDNGANIKQAMDRSIEPRIISWITKVHASP